jgi:hypothetical protein
MDMAQYNCTVNNAGPAANGAEAPSPPGPVVYINLTDEGGAFQGRWFYAADNTKSEMLAVALTAMSLQATVLAFIVDPPNEFTQIYRFYVNGG